MTEILITVPGLHEPGGVANYYATLALDQEPDVEYIEVTGGRRSLPVRLLRLTRVFLRLLVKLPGCNTVLVNPSFTRNSYWRDAFIVALARVLSRRVMVFWRGWDWSFYQTVADSSLHRWLFRNTFGRADDTIVLARQFGDAASKLGKTDQQRLHYETTVADDRLVRQDKSKVEGDRFNILFMSRMERAKGIFVVLDAYATLKPRYLHLSLTMAGSGVDAEAAAAHARELGLDDVEFPGYLRGDEKHAALQRADIFFFPTWYAEGMPNCVLEAMVYGLPVVSRPHAGIPDVVTHGEQGYLVDAKEADAFIPALQALIVDRELRERMSHAARQGSDRFRRAAVRGRMLTRLRARPY